MGPVDVSEMERSGIIYSEWERNVFRKMMGEGRVAKYLGWEKVDSESVFIYESNAVNSCYRVSKVEIKTGKLFGISVLVDDESIITRLKIHYNWMGGKLY